MTRRGPLAFALRVGFIAALIGLWQLAVTVFDWPAFIVPAPTQVARALYVGVETGLYSAHLHVTVGETLLGFALGCGLAFAFGSLIALSRTVEYYLYPLIVMFQAVPKVALVPIILTWFGLGITSKVVSAALVAFFPLMVNTIVGLRSADEDRVNLLRSLAASRWQIFGMLQLPSALPFLFAGLESAMIFALIGAIVAEFASAERGLGYAMQSMSFNMDTAGEFSILFVLAILGLVLNGAIRLVRRRVLFWDRAHDAGVPSPTTSPTRGEDP